MAGKIKQMFLDHFGEFLRLYKSMTRKVVTCIICGEVKRVAY